MKYLIILLFLFPLISNAQNWDSLGLGTDRPMRAFYKDTTVNELYCVGNFLLAGNDTVSCIAKWNGSQWYNLGDGALRTPGSDCNPVNSVTKFQNQIYACGPFFHYYKHSLARWNGISWDSIASLDGTITQYIEYQNELYIAGVFTNIGGIDAWGIAKWDGQNWSAIDTTKWNGAGMSTLGFYQGELYVGGNFRNDDQSIADLAKFNGTTWEAVSNYPFNTFSSGVNHLLEYNGRLFVGGSFKKPQYPGNGVMAWNGTNWDDLNNGIWGIGDVAFINQFHIYKDKLYAVGAFNTVGNIEANHIAVWNDTSWCGLDVQFTNTISTVIDFNDEIIIAIGTGLIDSVNYNHIAAWTRGDETDTCEQISVNTEEIIEHERIEFQVFPNPANDYLNIKAINSPLVDITIYNQLGQKVMEQLNVDLISEHQINIKNLPLGLYYLNIVSDKKSSTQKFIKK